MTSSINDTIWWWHHHLTTCYWIVYLRGHTRVAPVDILERGRGWRIESQPRPWGSEKNIFEKRGVRWQSPHSFHSIAHRDLRWFRYKGVLYRVCYRGVCWQGVGDRFCGEGHLVLRAHMLTCLGLNSQFEEILAAGISRRVRWGPEWQPEPGTARRLETGSWKKGGGGGMEDEWNVAFHGEVARGGRTWIWDGWRKWIWRSMRHVSVSVIVVHIVCATVFLCNVFGGAVRDIEAWKRRNVLIGPQRLDIHATNKTEETISSHWSRPLSCHEMW